ncbi:PepSY domain-containing protein [Gilvimarinus sp. DA14]|uniref:PepSY domain-containing protein n=1 Tax=Gilvimarinus sp. DA14 TaxID=2956798 RepID=UPI0020B67BEB|nr:PepSY domain-containing protein [Gilvimarinus sp. DA14]UTF59791.1 PepSY domain-containing protein [Gilvimarinus sp. DA14]
MLKWLIPVFAAVFCVCAQAAPPAPLSPPLSTPISCAISAAQAGKIASKTFGGKVIDIKQVKIKNRLAYRVKLLQQSGRIHSVLIDAASGRPLK